MQKLLQFFPIHEVLDKHTNNSSVDSTNVMPTINRQWIIIDDIMHKLTAYLESMWWTILWLAEGPTTSPITS